METNFSANGDEATGHPLTKKKYCDLILHCIQKLEITDKYKWITDYRLKCILDLNVKGITRGKNIRESLGSKNRQSP